MFMDHYKNIQELIEKDIILKRKHRIIESYSTLETYFNIGKNIVEAQGGEQRAKYGNDLINKWSKDLTDKQALTIKSILKSPIIIRVNQEIDELSERALKQFILEKTEEFLLELGAGFTCSGSEARLENYI